MPKAELAQFKASDGPGKFLAAWAEFRDQDAFVIVGDDKLEMDDLDAASRDDIIQKNEAVLLKTLEACEATGRILTVEELELCMMSKFQEYDLATGHAQASALKSMVCWVVRQKKRASGTRKDRMWLETLKGAVGPELQKKKFERKPSSNPSEQAAEKTSRAGSTVDQLDTLPMEEIGELQSKPSHIAKVQQIPCLEPPVCLPAVLVDLEVNPLAGLDPWAQHKKQFKAAKDGANGGGAHDEPEEAPRDKFGDGPFFRDASHEEPGVNVGGDEEAPAACDASLAEAAKTCDSSATAAGAQEIVRKVVHFPMNKKWYSAIKSGVKFWEFRRASSWEKRISYTKEVLGPTRILETKTLSIEAARQMGCPVDDKNYFDDGEIIGVRFAPFQESHGETVSEVPMHSSNPKAETFHANENVQREPGQDDMPDESADKGKKRKASQDSGPLWLAYQQFMSKAREMGYTNAAGNLLWMKSTVREALISTLSDAEKRKRKLN
ncbi:unnamed protein product [Durusdinium trenchii]|uniref:Uncharacterized protein n=1 Tax=Durusdinium trenchii TaxID=1381693 RepID=A0ABP0N2Q0_9DINO